MATIDAELIIERMFIPADAGAYKAPPASDQLATGVVYDGITGTFLGPPLYKPQEVHVSLAPLPQKVEVSLA